MRFGELMDGPRNKIIIISDVAKGSEAEKVCPVHAVTEYLLGFESY